MSLIPVILAGGTGSRLWPVSRELRPKQFLRLLDRESLLQKTIKRAARCTDAAPLIICNEAHRFVVAEQCREIGVEPRALILEPAARNTAPAIALAARSLASAGPETRMLVLPSDHVIGDVDAFEAAVRSAAQGEDDQLVTFGLTPSRAETGYGYIKAAGAAAAGTLRAVEAFVEKPDQATAQRYLESEDYFWNSGMFLFPVQALLAELEAHAPEVLRAVDAALAEAKVDLDFTRPGEAFSVSPSISIDYAVMEQTERAAVVDVELDWSDVGSWEALHEVSTVDEQGNALIGDVLALDSERSYLRAEHRLVATLGVQDIVVVETTDAVLVADKSRVQDIKLVVEELKQRGREEHKVHRRVFRPWGSYETVGDGARYQVKRIIVNPGASISLQLHHHRAEHWVIVRGTAEVTRGEEASLISETHSTFIPIGTVHRLRNPGKLPLELIEVQVGSYLGEDDIVRLQDNYGRLS